VLAGALALPASEHPVPVMPLSTAKNRSAGKVTGAELVRSRKLSPVNAQQQVEFDIGRPTSILPSDAGRLATVLRRLSDEAKSAATKLENAAEVGNSTAVKLSVGEDTAVLAALVELERSGDFTGALPRLRADLTAKLAREP